MFHLVRVRLFDGPAFRFLWLNPGSKKPPDIYQKDVNLLGAASSPAVRSIALRQAVRVDGDQQLLQQITWNFYVDNSLVSFTSSKKAISTTHHLTDALKKGGSPLTQWATLDDSIRKSLPGKQLDG